MVWYNPRSWFRKDYSKEEPEPKDSKIRQLRSRLREMVNENIILLNCDYVERVAAREAIFRDPRHYREDCS